MRKDNTKRDVVRINLLLEPRKVRELRRALRSRSNSEAVRRAIDETLNVKKGLSALTSLSKLGGLEDVFERAPVKNK
jgi:hypothetical protein